LFLQTRSNELIKKIDSQKLSVSEIYDQLSQDESIGFASYVYVEASYFAFASTMMAPKVKSFTDFVNEILRKIQISSHTFIATALLHQATRAEVMKMPFMGKSTVRVTSENTIFGDIVNTIRGQAQEFEDVDCFEITFKPKKSKDIKGAVTRLMQATPDTGLEKMVVKAKEALHENLTEIYLAGNGLISDYIDFKSEKNLKDRMKDKIENNTILSEKVAEYVSHQAISSSPLDSIVRYRDVSAWASAFDDL
jgi:hypothetical protein